MNMFCDNCGKQIPDTAKFCRFCGTPIVYDDMPSPDPTPAPAPKEETVEVVKETKTVGKYKMDGETAPAPAPTPKKEEQEQKIDDEPIEEYFEDEDEDEEPSSEKTTMASVSQPAEQPIKEMTPEEEEEEYEEEMYEDEDTSFQKASPIVHKDPETDEYWNDIIPQVEDELFRIPKSLFLKIGGAAIAVIIIIAWIIYMIY